MYARVTSTYSPFIRTRARDAVGRAGYRYPPRHAAFPVSIPGGGPRARGVGNNFMPSVGSR